VHQPHPMRHQTNTHQHQLPYTDTILSANVICKAHSTATCLVLCPPCTTAHPSTDAYP
jgi:hypothetical protein